MIHDITNTKLSLGMEEMGFHLLKDEPYHVEYIRDELIVIIFLDNHSYEVGVYFSLNNSSDRVSLHIALEYFGFDEFNSLYQLHSLDNVSIGFDYMLNPIREIITHLGKAYGSKMMDIMQWSEDARKKRLDDYYIDNDMKKAERYWKEKEYRKAKALYLKNKESLSGTQMKKLIYIKNMDKKNFVKTLHIVGTISLMSLGTVMVLAAIGKNPSSSFLSELLTPILLILGIPGLERTYTFSDLFMKRKPKKESNNNLRLVIYTIIAIVIIVIIILLPFSYSNTISDFPNLIRKDFSEISDANIESFEEMHGPRMATQIHIMTDNGTKLRIIKNAFDDIQGYYDVANKRIIVENKYTFLYLPNTGWVMDIIDGDGVSLRRTR